MPFRYIRKDLQGETIVKKIGFLMLWVGFSASMGQAVVDLPTPDEDGWIKLSRGDNEDDFFIYSDSRSNTTPADENEPFPNGTFSYRGDTIVVTGNATQHLMFKQRFSHYRVRFEMRFPGSTYNCGLLIHIQDDRPTAGLFPNSLEAQGDPRQGMGQLWCIGDVWVDVHSSSSGNPRWDPDEDEITYGGRDWNSRRVDGKDGYGNPSYSRLSQANGWVKMEADVHGADSIAHIVQDTVRIKYSNPRVSPNGTPNNVIRTLESGLISLQAEGGAVWYRNLEIMLYPEDPLYDEVYTTQVRSRLQHKTPRKVLYVKDGVLGFHDESTQGTFYDLMGRQNTRLNLLPQEVLEASQE